MNRHCHICGSDLKGIFMCDYTLDRDSHKLICRECALKKAENKMEE